ncbi:MAG: phosphoketolase family protein, partial [Sinobacteraceae bacterium]|nr:phosphoketolase family protein [Nevskiaceae bacterium]
IERIDAIQREARSHGATARPRWPMIVLQSPKGWTGPQVVDHEQVEGTWRAHQVPLAGLAGNPAHLRMLEDWLRSYRAQELFDEQGRPVQLLREFSPRGTRRMGSNPHANGGLLLRDLELPPIREYALEVRKPGAQVGESTRVLAGWLRDIFRKNAATANFRMWGPDETASNRLDAVFAATERTWVAELRDNDTHLAIDGRVMEVLSEHQCQGWLEGYLLSGRHGLFSCYEAFIHIVDSMFNQHAKWLEACRHIPWRRSVASLNILLTSHVWRQDHNGFSHQDPGFIDVVCNKKSDIVRVYLPPDANTLLCVAEMCLRSRDQVNVIIAGKQPEAQWLDLDAAMLHCATGIGIFDWASNDDDGEPDVVMACAGDVPTMETLAAVSLLRQHAPQLKVRVVNVVDLMTLQPAEEHPHGLKNREFDALFTTNKPVIFAFHGYPWLIHRLTYRRRVHENLHVRGYKEEGTTTTPFDMVVRNDLDRFHLVMDVIDRVPTLGYRAAALRQLMRGKLTQHKAYVVQRGEDMPEVRDWVWQGGKAASTPE